LTLSVAAVKMPSKKLRLSDKASLPFKTANKQRRQDLFVKQKKARGALSRAERFARKKAEAKEPELREQRLRNNVPATIDRKRVYDEVEDEPEDGGLGVAYDVERLKRRKLADEQDLGGLDDAEALQTDEKHDNEDDDEEDDADSMLDSASDEDSGVDDDDAPPDATDPLPTKTQLRSSAKSKPRAASPPRSTTSTNLSLAPAALAAKYPTLFPQLAEDAEPPNPKILITTSINSTLHQHCESLTTLFPNSKYVRRSSHRYGYKFSVREISSFAAKRDYTSVIVLEEDQKRPSGMTIVHLPAGPTFHFSITNWLDTSRIPGHGRATEHVPELILNNFTTPLGLLTAHLLKSLFPPKPDLEGRQVITFHNQRDFVFLRRFRYVLRDKRETEKVVVGSDGKPMVGAEGVRAGLQELGPRLTLKLRRVDRGIQRASGQDWEWKGKTDRVRTKFQL
jgi:ribosome production factor 1